MERTQDFTDSAYTSHEHRENILLLCDRTKLELIQLLRVAVNMVNCLEIKHYMIGQSLKIDLRFI